jgi:hypothetical protein
MPLFVPFAIVGCIHCERAPIVVGGLAGPQVWRASQLRVKSSASTFPSSSLTHYSPLFTLARTLREEKKSHLLSFLTL